MFCGAEAMATGSGASTPAAGEASTSATDKGTLWSILPSFDPQQDDPREYGDKVRFLHGICPEKDRGMLAPRLAMLMKGTAWAQVKTLDPSKLLDATNGVKTLLGAISSWEEAEELQVYDKFEKALYRTIQKSDESTQSYVNRLGVAFHDLGDMTIKDVRAFIQLRQSSLSVEDKKKVIAMVGHPLTFEAVEKAMRQLSTKILVGQQDGKRKVYPVNYVDEDVEEVNFTTEQENPDDELAIALLAKQGDEEAQLVQDFEDQLIEVCQENQDLAMCYRAYADARAKIRDRLRHRGFWPSGGGGKGRGKFGKKGGSKNNQTRFRGKKQQSLAERIANSSCRKCGAMGHWKWECPAKDAVPKEDVNVVMSSIQPEAKDEIVEQLPEGVVNVQTVEELLEMMNQDRKRNSKSPPVEPTVNEEFIQPVLTCSLTRQKVNGHCLGRGLIQAMTRKGECLRKGQFCQDGTECPGIIDTGASKTVIGQRKIQALIASMPPDVQQKMSWRHSETVFRFGNNHTLPSVGALYLPFGQRWMRIEVVAGNTPFLLSNSFLRAIDADVCTKKSYLRLNELGISVPLQVNQKGLFHLKLAEVIMQSVWS